jgi:hypothetical protein
MHCEWLAADDQCRGAGRIPPMQSDGGNVVDGQSVVTLTATVGQPLGTFWFTAAPHGTTATNARSTAALQPYSGDTSWVAAFYSGFSVFHCRSSFFLLFSSDRSEDVLFRTWRGKRSAD